MLIEHLFNIRYWFFYFWKWTWKSLSLFWLLWPPGLYSPWNSPGQNTGVGSLSLLQGSSQPRDRTQVSHIAGRFFTSWATREGLKHFTKENLFHKKSGWFSSTGDKLSGSGVSPGTQALSMFSCPSFCFCPQLLCLARASWGLGKSIPEMSVQTPALGFEVTSLYRQTTL